MQARQGNRSSNYYRKTEPSRQKTCLDCRRIPDFYMVHNALWDSLTHSTKGQGQLCWTCLEKRAKRKLTLNDILPCPASNERYFRLLVERRSSVRRRASLKQMRDHTVNTCVLRYMKKNGMCPVRDKDLLEDRDLDRCYEEYVTKLENVNE